MIWTCNKCGLRVPMKPAEFPIHCCCGLTETHEEAVNRGGLKDAVSTRCQHLRGVKESFNGRWLSCGCSRIYLYPCRYFDELVTLHAIRKPNKVDTAEDVRKGITDFHPEYKGRTCQGCEQHAPLKSPLPTVNTAGPLPIPTAGLSQDTARGIITGANEKHWTCLGALAIAAHEQHLGFAVADHGLSKSQRSELDRVGVRWIEHERPDNQHANHRPGIVSDKNAWWKAWICLASPFKQTLWIDSDTAVVGDLSPLFAQLPCVSTQWQFMDDGQKLYRRIFNKLFGDGTDRYLDRQTPPFQAVNTGIVGFERGELMLREWVKETLKILGSDVLLKKTTVRDQTAYVVMLMRRYLSGRPLPHFLGNEWNWPADGLHRNHMKERQKIPGDPAQFLAVSKERHPGVRIAHWLGKPKPWSLIE